MRDGQTEIQSLGNVPGRILEYLGHHAVSIVRARRRRGHPVWATRPGNYARPPAGKLASILLELQGGEGKPRFRPGLAADAAHLEPNPGRC